MNKYYGNIPGIISEMEIEHVKEVRDIAARGMVLLEHDDTLPLGKKSKVALYGYGARNTVFSGLGAASFMSREEISIEAGLERAGIIITSKQYLERNADLINKKEHAYYCKIREAAKEKLIDGVMKMYQEPFVLNVQSIITEKDITSAPANIAIFVLSRVSGEGADRKNVEGDYFLTADEKENLRIISEYYSKVIILLNVCGPVDTSYFKTLPNLSALLFIGYAAGVTGDSVADVLTGVITPEGKLVDTWAERYEDYPNAQNFAAMNGNLEDEYYTEGIYVGYRYFDSFGVRPAYPFGFGLSYTKFAIEFKQINKKKGHFILSINITNIGNTFSGREVVQVYVSAPSTGLHKAYQELKGFTKTQILKPKQTQTVQIVIDIKSLASYDESKAAWVLEKGDYLMRVGNSSKNTQIVAVINVEDEMICERCKNLCVPSEPIVEMSANSLKRMESLNSKDRFESIAPIKITLDDINCRNHRYYNSLTNLEDSIGDKKEKSDDLDMRYEDIAKGKISLDSFVNSLSIEEMIYLCVGNVGDRNTGSFACYGDDNTDLNVIIPMAPGACDTTRELMKSRGIPNMHMIDGGSGLRMLTVFEVDSNGNLLTDGILSVRNVNKIFGRDYIADRINNLIYEQYTTGLPIATILAQTWDIDLCRKCGEIVAKEMQKFHIELLLAPSMNIHRNPLCGRNFEYFSEDPLITGVCASAMIKGLQRYKHVGATIKHFSCNNQEENRYATNVHISERALREIYLKGYEIAIQEAHPVAMMTSYNLVNGIHTANNFDLLTSIARDEWGFNGMIMTDWGTTNKEDDYKRKYKASTCEGCIHAGNDLIMPGSQSDINELYQAVKSGGITVGELKLSAKRILKTMLNLSLDSIN